MGRYFARRCSKANFVRSRAKNLSRCFYEAIGGRYLKTAEFEIGGATLEEVAYGWEDVTVLMQD